MDNPDLYSKANSIQKAAGIQCLDEYSPRIKWGKGDMVIDLGCGDGDFTTFFKKHYMPKDFKKLVACDVSENMVKFANAHFGDDSTIFKVWDVQTDLPSDFKRAFNHVFSFFALHWILDQEKLFRNIYDLLTEGGDCLLTMLGYMPVIATYNVLAETERWRPWLKDGIKAFNSPYHDEKNPEAKITAMMKQIGFRTIEVKCKSMQYVFQDLHKLKATIKAVEPFNMPADVFEEFMVDFVEAAKELGFDGISCNYNLIVVHATK